MFLRFDKERNSIKAEVNDLQSQLDVAMRGKVGLDAYFVIYMYNVKRLLTLLFICRLRFMGQIQTAAG